MTIQEVIEERLNRFDNLWLKATGHTFKKDSDLYPYEMSCIN